MTRTLLSLFSGGGLADLGCKAVGYTPVGAVEWDAVVAGVYAENLGTHVLCRPVEEMDYRHWAGVTLVWASPCCTNASVANKDGEEAPEDISAAAAVARCLEQVRPRLFVLENVWQYRTFRAFRLVVEMLQALGYRWDMQHVNSAAFGVPQTRRRLILRAVLGGSVPPLVPTHTKGGCDGGLFAEHVLAPWVGWYAAIEDLIPTLPESRFAKWQLARLPAELGSCLIAGNSNANSWGNNLRSAESPAFSTTQNQNGRMRALLVSNAATEFSDGLRESAEPALSVTSQHGGQLRAFLVDGQQTVPDGDGRSVSVRHGDAPALTVPATAGKGLPRAVLVQGTSTLDIRDAGAPSACVMATVHSKAAKPRAVLVGGANTSEEQAAPGVGVSHAGEPSRCVNASNSDKWRAWLEQGRVVQMTPRALARFQSVPDTYILPAKNSLACRIIGNGVPPLLARRIAESLEGAL